MRIFKNRSQSPKPKSNPCLSFSTFPPNPQTHERAYQQLSELKSQTRKEVLFLFKLQSSPQKHPATWRYFTKNVLSTPAATVHPPAKHLLGGNSSRFTFLFLCLELGLELTCQMADVFTSTQYGIYYKGNEKSSSSPLLCVRLSWLPRWSAYSEGQRQPQWARPSREEGWG